LIVLLCATPLLGTTPAAVYASDSLQAEHTPTRSNFSMHDAGRICPFPPAA
jgi:hypothetical protein